HNLANLNTTGFKADLDALQSEPVYGPGHPGRVYVQNLGAGADFTGGQIIHTGRELDIAVQGDGFIAIQDRDGSEGYTRAGDLRVNPNGILENGAGYPIMGNGGPIALPPFEKLEIGSDGTVSIQPVGQDANTLAVVDRIKLVNPPTNELKKNDNGIFHGANGPYEPDATIGVVNGSIEASNVNAIDAMVKMIELSRQYEMQVKMMKTAQDNDAAAVKLMRVS
ncbi:MAG TPA: flagellar biosynthesis protein FlgF, partial [Gammaproteobacteria bacterium]|nr:flagellar biosynthesis protein FlgF [Gammaproteobacteria bacterium]